MAGHALLFLTLGLLATIRNVDPPRTRSIKVELLTEAQFRSETVPRAAAPSVRPTEPVAAAKPDHKPPAQQQRLPPRSIEAKRLFTGAILRDPANSQVRETLPTLERTERATQLCDIEAIEQIRLVNPTSFPDSVEAAAFAETSVTGLTVVAPGAAYRSHRRWYGVNFACSVAADYASVTMFRFELGKEIPEDEWDAHNLIAEDEDE